MPLPSARAAAALATAGCLLLVVVPVPTARADLAPPPERASGAGYAQRRVLPAADLDGDHRRDLVIVTQTGGDAFGDGRTDTVSVRSGRTGKQLWKRRVAIDDGNLAVYPVNHLGASGRPGVILVATLIDAASTHPSLVAGAYDGAGRTVWTHQETGVIDGTGFHDQPIDMAVTTVDHRPALLIDRFSAHATAYTGPVDASLQPVRISGVDGSVSDVGAPFAVSAGYANLTQAPDVTGDGTDEVVGIEHTTGDDHESVILRDGATGRDLWSADVAGTQPTLTYVQAVGDADGDGHADLAVQGYDASYAPLPATLLDGASGAVDWTRPGYAEAIGGGVHAVALLGSPVQALRADGSARWSNGGASGYVLGTGDVDGDGTHDLLAYDGSRPEVVASATGRTLWRGAAAAGTPLGVPVDRRGDDLVSLLDVKGGVRVTVHDGATGRPIWSVVRPGLRANTLTVEGEDVTADHCAEVLVDDGSQVQTLGGADGAVVWRLDLATGHRKLGRRPARCR